MKSRSAVVILVALLVVSTALASYGQEDFSADLLIEELRRAEELINKGEMEKGLESLKGVRSILDSKISELSGNGEGPEKEKLTELEKKLETFQARLSEMEGTEATGAGSALRVGYVNATEAFNVFTNAVKEERESAQAKNEELIKLREKAIQGNISESEFKKRSDILQAEKLKAQLQIDLAMVEAMIVAKGFQSVSDRLVKLKGQVEPIINQLNNVLSNMKEGSAIPEEVSQTLSQINSQYKQLDELLTKLIESKIFQVANVQARKEGYDLVLRQENVVLYGNQNTVKDLTEITKEALREEMSSE